MPGTAPSPGKSGVSKTGQGPALTSFDSSGKMMNKEIHHILDVESEAVCKVTRDSGGWRWE